MQHHTTPPDTDGVNNSGQAETATASIWRKDHLTDEHWSDSMLQYSETRECTSRIIGNMTFACLQVLAVTDRALKDAVELLTQRVSLTRATQALMLWSVRHKVLDGELDGVLSGSYRLQRIVVRSLEMIARELISGKMKRS
jgi:hypothetical protein